ncbi:NACHT, LRR and PYD domains-containing protein 12-like isoform X2 [Notamacropus eugenii]|uniref:NACHT, LRR and PYD domains-containing protein 12-like isoform X2 n=1 Tax=Notamacropus eugenii TaxID=9315 RepID=UPI003B67EDFB
MAETDRCRLAGRLERLTSEELKTFKLHLMDHLPRDRLKKANGTEVADVLVSSLGEQKAWALAASIRRKMFLRELRKRARKDNVGLVPAPFLPVYSDERINYQERMRKKFQLMRDRSFRSGEHQLFHHQFSELLLFVEYPYKEKKKHELLFQEWEHGEDLEEQGKFIEVSDLFDRYWPTRTQLRTVVLQGPAGIGKTTLAIKVMLDWAEGKLYQERFDYVFYLTCRELNPLGVKVISFADLIASDWPGPQAPMTKIMSQPERLLFIIDGLDELKFPCNEHRCDLCKDWNQQRPVPILLSSLLRKMLLPEASLLLTTSLTALGKFSPLLENPHHVEILGFSVIESIEYFWKFFRNKELCKKALNVVQGNDPLFTMCSVPLMTWIICTCLKQQEEKGQDPLQAWKTTTALYMCYINSLTPDDKNFMPQRLKGLCGLAAEGIWQRKLLFEEEDLRRHNLEAADVSAFLDMNIFQKDSGCENCYSFIHLSFQEFFAAMFYVISPDEEWEKSPDFSVPDVKTLLEECSQLDSSFVLPVVRFLFGFLNVEVASDLERKFRCRMSPEIKSQLLQWAQGETKRKHEKYFSFKTIFPEYFSHLYETQDTEFVTEALVNIQEIKVNIRYPYEALSAVYCSKHCLGAQKLSISCPCDIPEGVWEDLFSVVNKNQNLKELHLFHTRFVDSRMENLSAALRNPKCELRKLSLASCCLTSICSQNLFSALNHNKSLKDLDLSKNFFSEKEIKLLFKALENQNCTLEKLSLQSCYLSPASFQSLFTALNNNKSLKVLDLSKNFLAEKEIQLLCKALENKTCKLEKLSLQCCGLSPLCFQILFSALLCNNSLKDLDVSGNFIDDRASKLLCKALENQNCKLEKLSLGSCTFSPTWSQNLFSALLCNNSLKDLDVSGNFIDDRAGKLLCNALENQNCKLEKLSLGSCTFFPTWSQNLFSALLCNNNLKDLDVSGNFIDDRAGKLLCNALENQNCKLEKLSLASCCLTPEYSQNLLSALNSNESLKELDLSGNSLEEGGIKRLCMALANPNCKLEKLSLASCDLTSTCYPNLFSALRSNKSLKDLDLSGNSLEEMEIKLLYMALGNQNSELDKLRHCMDELHIDPNKQTEALMHIKTSMKNIETIPYDDVKEEECHNSPQEHLGSGSEEVVPQTKQEVTSSPSPFDTLKDEQLELERCHNKFLGPNGPVKLQEIDKKRNLYRVHLPMAGFYHWPDTGLGFSVTSEVTVDIEFGTWNQHLDWTQRQNWMIAGPLFHIRVDPGVVTSVHLPHFVYLEGGNFDVSLFKIAHFKEEGMVLENPTRIESSHAILENPSFSPMGVLLRIIHSTLKFFPIYSTTLIYCRLRAKDITFHLYLIPSDCTIKKAIDEEETKFRFLRLHKPSPVAPLYIGSRFIVSGSKHLEIMPAELELCYRSAGECQVFSEIYSDGVKENISLDLRQPDGTLVWETLVRSGDLELALACAPGSSSPTGQVPDSLNTRKPFEAMMMLYDTSENFILESPLFDFCLFSLV